MSAKNRPECEPPIVLVVNHHEAIARLMQVTLERQGFRVTTLQDPEWALKRLQCGGVDVLVVGLMLGRVNGFGLLQRVQDEALLPFQHIVLTGPLANDRLPPAVLNFCGEPFVLWNSGIETSLPLPADCDRTQVGIYLPLPCTPQAIVRAVRHCSRHTSTT